MSSRPDPNQSTSSSGSGDELDEPDDPITRKILMAALESFGRLGFKKTTIRAIAASAGVSRPTVYARYGDKLELVRGVAAMVNRDALDAAMRVIAQGGPFDRVLEGVLIAYFGDSHEKMSALPHIEELVESHGEHVRAAIEDGQRGFRVLLSRFLRKSVREGSIKIRPTGVGIDQLVDVLALSPLAFKSKTTPPAEYYRRLRSLARLTAHALAKESAATD